jgi:hypothetical protein
LDGRIEEVVMRENGECHIVRLHADEIAGDGRE